MPWLPESMEAYGLVVDRAKSACMCDELFDDGGHGFQSSVIGGHGQQDPVKMAQPISGSIESSLAGAKAVCWLVRQFAVVD